MAEAEEVDQHNRELTAAVETYIQQMEWAQPDLVLTDVMVIAVRRGFDPAGGKSITSTIIPTDSAIPLLLGMTRYAQMYVEKIVAESFLD